MKTQLQIDLMYMLVSKSNIVVLKNIQSGSLLTSTDGHIEVASRIQGDVLHAQVTDRQTNSRVAHMYTSDENFRGSSVYAELQGRGFKLGTRKNPVDRLIRSVINSAVEGKLDAVKISYMAPDYEITLKQRDSAVKLKLGKRASGYDYTIMSVSHKQEEVLTSGYTDSMLKILIETGRVLQRSGITTVAL